MTVTGQKRFHAVKRQPISEALLKQVYIETGVALSEQQILQLEDARLVFLLSSPPVKGTGVSQKAVRDRLKQVTRMLRSLQAAASLTDDDPVSNNAAWELKETAWTQFIGAADKIVTEIEKREKAMATNKGGHPSAGKTDFIKTCVQVLDRANPQGSRFVKFVDLMLPVPSQSTAALTKAVERARADKTYPRKRKP